MILILWTFAFILVLGSTGLLVVLLQIPQKNLVTKLAIAVLLFFIFVIFYFFVVPFFYI